MMLQERDRELLLKIISHCDEIISDADYVGTLENLQTDNRTYRATTQSIAQIGELSKRLSADLIESTKEINWKGVKGIREMVVHDYVKLDLEFIWAVMTEHIVTLRSVCLKQLR